MLGIKSANLKYLVIVLLAVICEKASSQSEGSLIPNQISGLFGETKDYSYLVGNWEVTMKSIFSDCSRDKVGSIMVENWIVTYQNENIVVNVSSGSTGVKRYDGYISDGYLILSYKSIGLLASQVSIIAQPDSNHMLSGIRSVSKSGPCMIQYRLTAKKK